MARRHILTIDGGGVRGLVAAIVLEALQAERVAAGKTRAIGDCFDLIAGVSSGALIAAALAVPSPDGGPSATTAALRHLFEARAREIFPIRFFNRIPLIGRIPQLFGPLYDPAPFQKLLAEQFGDTVFASARRNVMIAAYSIDPRATLLFRGGPAYEGRKDSAHYAGVKIRDAVLGSSSAPTFFPPHLIDAPTLARSANATQNTDNRWATIDGGVFLNDPAMAAYAEAQRLFPGDEFRIISIGTGRQTRNYPYEKARRWGFSEWVSPTGRFRTPLISVIQDGQARAVNRQLMYLLGDNYFRFDYRLEKGRGSDMLDDASKRNLKALTRGALEMTKEMRPQLQMLAREMA